MEYSKLKASQLKEELKRRGLKPSGVKREMVSLLIKSGFSYVGTVF